MQAVVESIHIAPRKKEPTQPVERALAVPGRGLEGDRYFNRKKRPGPYGGVHDLTLIDAGAAEAIGLEPGDARRNVVVRGIDLDALVGRRFRIGSVECLGHDLAHPCRRLERLTRPGVLRGLAGRGGLYAGIVSGGEIAVGDPVEALG
ncbi:MAG TPA: MOSC domain-containing protein [Thermoleophilaceae bacterium]|jgi:MOSC domain-containing protein YiiM